MAEEGATPPRHADAQRDSARPARSASLERPGRTAGARCKRLRGGVSARRQASWSSASSPCPSIRRAGSSPRRSRRTASWCCSPSELGFTEGYIGEHVTDAAENISSAPDLHRLAAARDQADQARHRHGQSAQPPSGDGRGRGRAGRPHGQGPLHLRHQPGRAALGRRGVRQSRPGPHRDVRRGDRPDPRDLERRAALRPRGPVLDHLDRAHADPRARPGHDRQALPAAAPADRGDRGGAVLQGRDRGGGARLGPDLGELPAAAVGQDPLAELRRGLRAGRPHRRPQELAGRQEHLRRRRRGDRQALRDRSRRARITSTTTRCSPS